MDAMEIDLFRLADRRLAWADQRQALLAQNVANANTPGFRAKDLAPFSAVLSGTVLAQTSPRHVAGSQEVGQGSRTTIKARSPNGNAVSLEDQLVQVADTASAQELTLNLYRRYQAMFRIAIGRGS